jgi:far upstream element-binding protein
MQNNPTAFQDAVARAKQIAQKLLASAPNTNANSPLKRSNSEDDYSNKRPALTSPIQTNDIPVPVLRAQQIAQQINSQLGVKTSNDSSLLLSTFQEDYKIPDKFVGLIIGKGGEQIVRLQAESGCKVQICQSRPDPVPGGPNPPDRLANLSGTREAIDRAKRIMDDIISRGRMADGGPITLNPYSLSGSNSTTIDVMLPSAKCGLVIGKGGENIKRVSEEFGVKLYVAQETTDIDGIEHKPLRIMGEPDRIARAKQYVLDSLSKSGGLPIPTNRTGPNSSNTASYNDYGSKTGSAPMNGPCNETTYHVPYEKAGIIIGKGLYRICLFLVGFN